MKINLTVLFVAILLIAGCASVTKDIRIQSEVAPKANLQGYSSYAWLGSAAIVYDPQGKWEPPQFDADAEIKFLIDRELRQHGLTESSVNPDMIVAYGAGIDMARLELKFDPEDELERLTNVPKGALVVVLVDATTGLAIWGGVATADIQENPTQDEIKQRLDYAVTKMFDRLPK